MTSSFATQSVSTSTTTSSASQASSTGNVGSTDVSGSFGGCFEVRAGLDVTAGAEAAFFKFFDQSTQVTLFSKTFELFKKCFGTVTAKRSSRMSRLERASINRRAGLVCPGADIGTPAPVTDQTISAASITTV